MIDELVIKNRSYRRFCESEMITEDVLKSLVDTARKTPSAANRQPIRYKLVWKKEDNSKVYPNLKWAGYYKDWDGPKEDERPSAYIFMCTPKEINALTDIGIAGQTVLLKAAELGLGGCFLGNIEREKLMGILDIPNKYKIDLCIALGKPKEISVIEDIYSNEDIKYYRDNNEKQHVPKIKLEDILI